MFTSLSHSTSIGQAFQKPPFLQPPTQSQPPFQVAQAAVLALFVVCGIMAVKKFHPEAITPA